MERTDPDLVGDERTLLTQFLDFHRATIAQKTAGLSDADFGHCLAPSTMSVAGLVKHLTLVEDFWFDHRFLGSAEREPWASVDWDADPDWEWRTAAGDDPAHLLAEYAAACERSRAIVAGTDLGRLSAAVNHAGEHWSLRWILLHMLEETARHVGHLDLLRQSIDGTVGE
jgi:hypothetical protein